MDAVPVVAKFISLFVFWGVYMYRDSRHSDFNSVGFDKCIYFSDIEVDQHILEI